MDDKTLFKSCLYFFKMELSPLNLKNHLHGAQQTVSKVAASNPEELRRKMLNNHRLHPKTVAGQSQGSASWRSDQLILTLFLHPLC